MWGTRGFLLSIEWGLYGRYSPLNFIPAAKGPEAYFTGHRLAQRNCGARTAALSHLKAIRVWFFPR